MIKFLHTADLHLGKIFHDQSLAEDQAAMLEDLARLLEDGGYAALVIAGDVYDRSIPPPDAVELFGSFLARVKKAARSPEIIVIPGNHDSASRLGFGRELFARLGLRFGVLPGEWPVIVERDGESCAFFLLPFFNAGVFSAEEAALSMEKARLELDAPNVHPVLVSHLFAAGGEEAGSERVFLGSAERVNISLFRGFDYIALGHLHRCQRAGENAWYSGSPLVYSFGEVSSKDGAAAKKAEKFFLSVELGGGGAKVEKIPVKPRRKVTSLTGPFARFNEGTSRMDDEIAGAADDYLEIRLTDRTITENARDVLRKRFPLLLSLRQDEALAGLSSAARAPEGGVSGERRNLGDDFRGFLENLYGEDFPMGDEGREETELFNALAAEIETGETPPPGEALP